jgi:hypothetical protein
MREIAFVVFLAFLAGCVASGSTEQYVVSTALEPASPGFAPPSGMNVGDPAPGQRLEIQLEDAALYPDPHIVVADCRNGTCSSVSNNTQSRPKNYLSTHRIEPPTLIKEGDTIVIPEGADHAHYFVVLDNQGSARFSVKHDRATNVYLSILEDGHNLGPTVNGCQYEYVAGHLKAPPRSFDPINNSWSVVVPFDVQCHNEIMD